MANRDWRQSKARCPYYFRSTDKTITCTCGAGGMKGAKFIGESPASCTEWFQRHCATHWTACPITKMISKIVEDEP